MMERHDPDLTYGNVDDVRGGRDLPYGRARVSVTLDKPTTAVDLCTQSGLADQQIFKAPVFIRTTKGMRKVDNQFAIGRKDTEEVFQVASSQYTIKQNIEAAHDLDTLTHGHGGFVAAGSLGGGRKVYYVADLGTSFDVGGGDEVRNQLLLTNTHNGGGAMTAIILPFRLSCLNQLNVAMSSAKTKFKMVHKASIEGFADRAVQFFSEVEAYNEVFAAECRALREKTMARIDQHVFAYQLLELDPNNVDAVKGGQRRNLDELLHTIAFPTGFDRNERDTAWALFNAVTEWVDHTRNPRAQDELRSEKRFESSLYGVGADLKQRAWDLLTV